MKVYVRLRQCLVFWQRTGSDFDSQREQEFLLEVSFQPHSLPIALFGNTAAGSPCFVPGRSLHGEACVQAVICQCITPGHPRSKLNLTELCRCLLDCSAKTLCGLSASRWMS